MTFANILIALLAFLIGVVVQKFLPGYFRKKGETSQQRRMSPRSPTYKRQMIVWMSHHRSLAKEPR
jgi:hypothetical protein